MLHKVVNAIFRVFQWRFNSVSLVIYTTCLNIVYCFLVSYFTQLLHSKQGYEKLQAGLLRRDPNNYLSRFTEFVIYLEITVTRHLIK